MATKIKVNTDSLQKTKEEVQEKLSQMQDKISEISTSVSSLSAMWTGEAHAAFTSQAQKDVEKLTEAVKGLESIVTFEETAVKEYKACETKVSDLISSISI